MRPALLLAGPLVLALSACGPRAVVIDARGDAGPADATDAGPPTDAGDVDAGSTDGGRPNADAGPPPDGGCMDPPPPAWIPADTNGPSGEGVLECASRVGPMTDDRLPANQYYELTTFGGPGDEQPVACSGADDADGTWYYAANSQRFRCGQRVRLVNAARDACVVVEVADLGPNLCVEEAGGQPIWDVSPLAAQHLVGSSAVGWSEHEGLFGAPVDSDNALGPCDAHLSAPNLAGFVGGACTSAAQCGSVSEAVCLTDGWPGGTCSRACETSCPDLDGALAYTACVALDDGERRCLPRCDYTLFAEGCRSGYACVERPHPTGSGPSRRVCMPSCE